MSVPATFVKCVITDYEIHNSELPVQLFIKQKLIAHGFKFVDQELPSFIIDLNPTPYGTLTLEREFKRNRFIYKQVF